MDTTGTLNRADWVSAGLQALGQQAKSVPSALSADALARSLGVSRGSFYWHFKNVAEFHAAVLEAWEANAVTRPYFEASSKVSDPLSILTKLSAQAFKSSVAAEAAVFAWARDFPPAKESSERVNRQRLEILKQMFAQMGYSGARAEIRAYLLCAAYLARMHAGLDRSWDEAIILETLTNILDRERQASL